MVVSERYWPDGSGGELATHLIVGLLKEHFDVTVVTGSPQVERHKGVAYIYDPLLSRREKILLWPNVERLAHKEKFRELLRSADIVYVPRFASPLIPAAKREGKRVVVHLHGYSVALKPAIVVALGDTNTVLATALTAVKLSIPFAHIEAGARSWNINMPEEVNRKVADSIASLHYASTQLAAINLLFEDIPRRRIYITGSTAVDVVNEFIEKVKGYE
ncbi:UDP-N-acetylglucosamine 2-epimerase [Pyrobaculum aerophilum]|uniref:UDP-N-acetylglucosamine 2-epimerase n=1 Tax=Pyrobaculum aerophilum TaxID=13773 RepID=UPI0023F1D548|nr:UDP-N-acetylglucosamine 2-epimerase [Pyrobaculum aerophilum]MCX8137674.1 UDP-N-acetylglucosamine 2-epimerase [Pyrobaculum aerophilum]